MNLIFALAFLFLIFIRIIMIERIDGSDMKDVLPTLFRSIYSIRFLLPVIEERSDSTDKKRKKKAANRVFISILFIATCFHSVCLDEDLNEILRTV